MTKFNRLKQLTTNHKIIATALRKSDSGLIQVGRGYVMLLPVSITSIEVSDRFNENLPLTYQSSPNFNIFKVIPFCKIGQQNY